MPIPKALLPVCMIVCLLAAGVGLFVWAGGVASTRFLPAPALAAAFAVICCLALPPLIPIYRTLSDRCERLSPVRHAIAIVLFGLLVAAHILLASVRGGRYWVPLFHDEQMYLTQARQMASFHLAMPALPFPQFFETFYVFVTPVYASMYFPGTALAYVPAIWLHLPWVAWPVFIMTAGLLMTYLVAARLLGRLLAVVAVLCVLGTGPMNYLPTMTQSHPLGMLLGMTQLYAYLRWRRHPGYGWAVLFGVAAGWMAITRPLESIAFGLPPALVMLSRMKRVGVKRVLSHAAVAAACAVPFLTLQLVYDHIVTGSYTKLPIAFYNEREFPRLPTMGTNITKDSFVTTSTLPEKVLFARTFVPTNLMEGMNKSFLQGWLSRLQKVLDAGLPSMLLSVLVPLSLPLVWRKPDWIVVWLIPLLFITGFVFYGAYLPHYTIQVAPLLAILALGGCLTVSEMAPSSTVADKVRLGFTLVPAALAVCAIVVMPNRGLAPVEWDLLKANYEDFPRLLKKPALLFIRFGPTSSAHVELVYNLEAAWPDDAEIVRMHDFGAIRNLPVLKYYAQKQPDRNVYQFDRETRTMTYLGNVKDVVAKIEKMIATSQPS